MPDERAAPWDDHVVPIRRQIAATCAAGLVVVLAACGGDDAPPPAAAPTPPPSSAPTPSPTPAPPKSPLTGAPGGATGPVLVAKVDNTANGRPQVGLGSADVVYVELVEGGLSRVAAVFASKIPERIGPIRSARITDLELVRPYGRVLFAYSGANSRFLPSIARAPLRDLSVDKLSRVYARDRSRPAPYNLFVDGRAMASTVSGKQPVPDVGFRFGAAPAGGRSAKSVTVSYPAARIGFAWSATAKLWQWSMDGRKAGVGAATVVVQYVTVASSPYKDVNGSPTPFSKTVGSGKATILRDGKSWSGSWRRATATSGTTYTAAGAPMPFATGPVFVVLTPKGRTARVS